MPKNHIDVDVIGDDVFFKKRRAFSEMIIQDDLDKLYEEGESIESPDDEIKPYPNEHACRVREPSAFKKDSFRRISRGEGNNRLFLIIGKLKGDDKTTVQAYRYPVKTWDEDRARSHCTKHKGIRFEPAAKEGTPEMTKIFEQNATHSSYGDIVKNLEELYSNFYERLGDDGVECHLELKEVDEEKREIEGFANTRELDLHNDIVEEQSFRETLPYYKKNGILLLHHHPALPFGTPLKMEIVKNEGLWGRWKIFKGLTDFSYIEEAWNLITQKGLKALSIGFRTLKSKLEKLGDDDDAPTIRRILKLILLEVSVVSIPANRQSLFNVSKAFTHGTDLVGADGSDIYSRRCEQLETEDEYTNTEETRKKIRDTILKAEIHNALTQMREIDKKIKKGV